MIASHSNMFAKYRHGGDAVKDTDSTQRIPAPKRKANTMDQSETKKKKSLERKWQERYRSICDACFDQVRECPHFVDKQLRLLIVGHNPSDHAWESGFSYSNPSNRLWKLLSGEFHKHKWAGVLPLGWSMHDQNRMPFELGIGFSDLGIEPGNDASIYGKSTMLKWKVAFYKRLREHMRLVSANLHGEAVSDCSNVYKHAPMLIAFSGKRQYTFLFDSPPKHPIPNGKQETKDLPMDWPLPRACEVWVLPSSSGRAAMTDEQRCKPYKDLAARFHELDDTLNSCQAD